MILETDTDLLAEQDLRVSEHKLWLSGFFGIAGQASFMKTAKDPDDYTPVIGKADKDKNYIIRLRELFGGGKYPQGDSWIWRIYGFRAADIITMLGPFLPSHSSFVAAVTDWKSCQSPSERAEVAYGYKENLLNQQIDGYKGIQIYRLYLELIDQPKRVAGILDNRLSLKQNKESSINSKNRLLTQALADKFNGSNILLEQYGPNPNNHTKIYRSSQVNFGKDSTQGLLEFAGRELLVISNK